MIKLDRTYSDYTELDDENYPNGKAVDCTTDESYDGTPIKKELVNDLHGALEAVVAEAEGDIEGVSGQPDNIGASDFKDAIKKLIDTPDNAHAALRGPDAHGATVAATPGQIITRDDNGRAQVADPVAADDIANKGWVEGITGLLSNLGTTVKTNIVAALNEVRTAFLGHAASTDNPHSVNKKQLGLENVDNTADANKNVNYANSAGYSANSGGVEGQNLWGLTTLFCPIGTILPYGGASAPAGFLLCNGQAVSRNTYKNLFNVIGGIYGGGDGRSTFNVPNLSGRTLIGSGTSSATGAVWHNLGSYGGEETHTLTTGEMPSHDHFFNYKNMGNRYGISMPGNSGNSWGLLDVNGIYPGQQNDYIYISPNGGGAAHNNMQPYVTVNYIIKY